MDLQIVALLDKFGYFPEMQFIKTVTMVPWKIQDWILNPQRILGFFTGETNPTSVGLWCIKGIEESILDKASLIALMRDFPTDLGLICLVQKRKICCLDLRIQFSIFPKKRSLRSIYLWTIVVSMINQLINEINWIRAISASPPK